MSIFWEAGLLVVVLLLLWKSGGAIKEFFASHFQLSLPWSSRHFWPKNLAEDDELSKLMPAAEAPTEAKPGSEPAKTAVAASAKSSAPAALNVSKGNEDAITSRALLEDFSSGTPPTFATLEDLCEKLKRGTNQAANRELLADICAQLQSLKNSGGMPQLRVVWQMASALEGLLKQLINRVSYITPSTLRTVSMGLEVVRELCSSQAASDALTTPPIRVLAVDDDPISRYALTWAVKKAFNQVDTAENGSAALELAGRQAYDVIFLDIRMPGMDGFELCSNIRETTVNRTAPVVFVTAMKDFDSRVDSVASGNDIIAKPFLGFEITVKTLTLALQRRIAQLKSK